MEDGIAVDAGIPDQRGRAEIEDDRDRDHESQHAEQVAGETEGREHQALDRPDRVRPGDTPEVA